MPQRSFLGSPAFGIAFLLGAVPAAAEPPAVVASIGPIHSLVAGVMGEVGQPTLLVEGSASPHDYNMKPSDALHLQAADLVFWVGPGLETFLTKPVDLARGTARVVTLSEVDGLTLYATREGGAWEAHDHDHEAETDDAAHEHEAEAAHDHEAHAAEAEHDHEAHAAEAEHEHEAEAAHDHEDEHGGEGHAAAEPDAHDADHDHTSTEVDFHLWLDPVNAIVMTEAIAEALSATDPAHAGAYAANAARLEDRINSLDREIAAQLEPVRDRPFIVFHDAYQYFERHYDLAAAGAITVGPERAPGARRLREIQERLAASEAVCVFSEPQFEPAVVETVVEGTSAKTGVLDPIGAELEPGPELYPALLSDLAEALAECLGPARS